MAIRTTFSGSGMIARHEQAEKELQNRMDEEWREFVLGPTNDEIIKELAKNTEGEYLQVRKPQKREIK